MVQFFCTSEKHPLRQLEKFEPLCWVDMINPTDDEMEDVAALSGISEDMLASALDDQERARSEIDDGNYMFILDCPVIEDGESGDVYSTLPLAVIYNTKCVVTVCLKGNPVLKDFITGRQRVMTEKPVLFTLNFMLGNAKRFLNILTQIDRKSRRVQAELGKTMKNEEIAQLLDLENSLVYISTSLNSNYSVQEKLSNYSGKIQAGTYILNTSMTTDEMLEILSRENVKGQPNQTQEDGTAQEGSSEIQNGSDAQPEDSQEGEEETGGTGE